MVSTSSKVRITSGKSPAHSIAKERLCMKDLLEISCGLDVHKDKIVACILTGPLGKPTNSEIREFTTLIPDMIALRDWIVSQNCHHVAMESTGIYWMPIYEILEEAFGGDITLLVVNARHMKNVPGKKTDMRDSEWISTLLRAGLLNGSFIPEKRIRKFRDLNRYRKSVIRDMVHQLCDFLRSINRGDFCAVPFFLGKNGWAEISLCNPFTIREGQEPLYYLRHGIHGSFGVDTQAVQERNDALPAGPLNRPR